MHSYKKIYGFALFDTVMRDPIRYFLFAADINWFEPG